VQLRDDLMTMLIAGHETTAAVLTWAAFMLAQVPLQLQTSAVSFSHLPAFLAGCLFMPNICWWWPTWIYLLLFLD